MPAKKKKDNKNSLLYQMAQQQIRRLDRRGRERRVLAHTTRNINRLRRTNRRYVVEERTTAEVASQRARGTAILQSLFARNTLTQFFTPIRDRLRSLGTRIPLERFDGGGGTEGMTDLYEWITSQFQAPPPREYIIVDNQNRQVAWFETDYTNLYQLLLGGDSDDTIFGDYRFAGLGGRRGRRMLEDVRLGANYIQGLDSLPPQYTGSFYIRPYLYRPPEQLPNRTFLTSRFADNETTDCVIVPIEEKIQEKINKFLPRHTKLKAKKKKKSEKESKELRNLTTKLSRQNNKLKVCEKYREISKKEGGLTLKQIQELANEIRFSIHMYIPYLDLDEVWVGNKGADDKISLYNTRFNHLDKADTFYLAKKSGRFNELEYVELDDQYQLCEKFNEYLEKNEINMYNRNDKGIASFICNQTMKFSLGGSKLYQKFVSRLREYTWYIRHDDEDSKSWANNMTAVCGCIDFMSVKDYRKIKEEGGFLSNVLQSVDRTKSYFNYDKCGEYQNGVAGKFLHSGAMPADPEQYQIHLKHYRDMGQSKDYYLTYSIYDVEITDPKLKFYISRLNIIQDYSIVSEDILQFLDKHNTTYKVCQYKVFSRIQENLFDIDKDITEQEQDDTDRNAFFTNGHSIKDGNGCALYSKFVGKLMRYNHEYRFQIAGCPEHCAVISNLLREKGSSTIARYSDYHKDITITTPKNIHTTLTQIAASITQKQVLCVLEQLMVMDHTKIVRVIGDGIYTIPHDFEVLDKYAFRIKYDEEDFKMGSNGGKCFTSNVPHDWENFFNPSANQCFVGVSQHLNERTGTRYKQFLIKEYGEFTDLYKTTHIPHLYCNPMIANGGGGSGKTHWCMKSYLEQNRIKEHEVLFLSPTHNLANEIRLEYFEELGQKGGHDVCYTRHKVSGEMAKTDQERAEYLLQNEYIRKGKRVMVVDEFTQINNKVLDRFINEYKNTFQIILVGDIGFRRHEGKLYPYNYQVGDNISSLVKYIRPDQLNIKSFGKDHRAKCPKLRHLKLTIRNAIDKYENENPDALRWDKRRDHTPIIQTILNQFQELHTISIDDIKEHFVLNETRCDVVVSGYNDISSSNLKVRKRYLDRLKGGKYSRYRYKDSTIYETLLTSEEKPKNSYETYCMSCNSIQGTTIKAPNRVFVDLQDYRCMFSLQHFFVAISRVQYLDQITIVKQ